MHLRFSICCLLVGLVAPIFSEELSEEDYLRQELALLTKEELIEKVVLYEHKNSTLSKAVALSDAFEAGLRKQFEIQQKIIAELESKVAQLLKANREEDVPEDRIEDEVGDEDTGGDRSPTTDQVSAEGTPKVEAE